MTPPLPPEDVLAAREAVCAALSRYRFTGRNERAYQDAIESVLTDCGLEVEREVILTPQDRIDFMVGGLGIEVKTDDTRARVIRQLGRYAGHERVQALLLVSSKPELALSIPPVIHDVSVRGLALRGRLV